MIGKISGLDALIQLVQLNKTAPVKSLDFGTIADVLFRYQLIQSLGKVFWRSSKFRLCGIVFNLYLETDFVAGYFFHESNNLPKGWDRRTVNRSLMGKIRSVLRPGFQSAHIIFLELVQR